MAYPDNSFIHQESKETKEEPVIRESKAPIAQGKRKEDSFWKMFAEAFLPEDVGPRDIRAYIAKKVVAPSVKDFIYAIICDSLHMRLYGNTAARSGNSNQPSYVNYYANKSIGNATCSNRESAKKSDMMPDIEYDSQAKAEKVLAGMRKAIYDYGLVTVADYIDMSSLVPNSNDFKYGWSDLSGVKVIRNFNRNYEIQLPTPRQIDQ